MILGNASRGRIVAREVVPASTGWRRLFLLWRQAPAQGQGLRFAGPAFWAAFARRPVDVVFLDGARRVVAVVPRLRPWRGAGPFEGAQEGIVLDEGTCEKAPVAAGDLLEFTPTTGERVAAGARPPDHF